MKLSNKIIALQCTAKGGYCYCVKTNDGYTLIDTGMPGLADKIIEELSQFNIFPSQIKKILLTHGDVDHIGNVNKIRKITGCDVYADEQEIPYLEKKKRYGFVKAFFKIILHIGKILNVKPLPDNNIGEIKIIKTPGHTPGHTCFKFENAIFLGDLVATNKNKAITILPKLMTFNPSQVIDSIKSLDVTGVKFLYLAHGGTIEVFEWKEFVKLIQQ